MIVSINQPAYLPWLGYFYRIAVSDRHVVLDHVQFEKNSFVNRNKVRTKEGWCWLTVPLKTAGRFGDLAINSVELADDPRWRKKHWETLLGCYRRAPYFAAHAPFFEMIYKNESSTFNGMLRETLTYLCSALGITTPLSFSSEMVVEGKRDDMLLMICRQLGATTYLSGTLGRQYLRESIFEEAGIRVAHQDYVHPTYPQLFGDEFFPAMAVVDLLFNCGPRSLSILMSGNQDRAMIEPAR
jgi:hypothetical protein